MLRVCGVVRAVARRSRVAAISPASPPTAARAGPSSTGGTMAMFTITPMAAPMIVSMIRATA